MDLKFKSSHWRRMWLSVFLWVKGRWGIYGIATLCLYLSIGQLAHLIEVDYISSGLLQVRRLSDAAILALPVLCWKRKGVVGVWMVLVELYFISVLWYFRTYATIMPLSSYLMFHNTDGLGSYIQGSWKIQDLTVVAPGIVFLPLYACRGWKEGFRKVQGGWWALFLAVLVSIPYWPNRRPFYEQPLYLYGIVCPRAFKEYGVVNFWINQLSRLQTVSAEEKQLARYYMAERRPQVAVSLATSHPRNLIVVLAESLQSWAIGLHHQGVEVTPVMNRLLQEEGTVYFPKMLSQVKDGRSSDAQLLINTGLLPLYTGAASSLCADNTFPSLPRALRTRGYRSVSLICDNKDFWNQGRTTKAYGFDDLYDRLQQEAPKREADSLLLAAAVPVLADMQPPYYAQLVTYSTHMPYNQAQCASELTATGGLSEEVRNYLIAVQLFDRRLGVFLAELKRRGIYDQSVIVIVGDHEQVTLNQYENRKTAQPGDCLVPFLVLNSPLPSQHTAQVVGQVDLYPSLLHLMGCTDYPFTGLGESVFADSISRVAVYHTGEPLAAQGAMPAEAAVQHRKAIWRLSDILLRMDYFAE